MDAGQSWFELGAVLPNFGEQASPQALGRVAEAAEELGFDHVWVAEHLLVGKEAESYGRVLDPLACLAWIAGRLERVGLGTSIVLLPLHHPVHLAKQAASLQELSGGRFKLGVGVGWHEPEFRFLGYRFEDRGRRADEALRLIRALWAGERDFRGEYWSFEGAHFAPLPEPVPEVWIGGSSRRSLRRARELGDAWHPNSGDLDDVRAAKESWPEGRVIPRVALSFEPGQALSLAGPPKEIAARIEEFRTAGADGLVISFGAEPDESVAAMARFMREVAPRFRERS